MRTMLVMIIIIFLAPFVQAKSDLYNGTYKEYYPNGVLRSIKEFKDGKNEGISREYYSNGRLAFVQTVRNGKINGPVKAYYENGRLKGEVHYVDNLEEGVLKEYYDNGKVMEEVSYIRGDIVNIKKFDREGNLVLNQESNFPPGCKVVVESRSEKF